MSKLLMFMTGSPYYQNTSDMFIHTFFYISTLTSKKIDIAYNIIQTSKLTGRHYYMLIIINIYFSQARVYKTNGNNLLICY